MNKYLSDFRIIIIFAVVSLFGYFLIPQLNIRLNPQQNSAVVFISYSMYGASPEVVDKKISSVIEQKISLLDGIKDIKTVSKTNFGYISVSLDKYTDVDKKRLEIAASIRQIIDKLPQNISYPQISLNDPDDDNKEAFLIYQIFAPKSPYEIKQIIDKDILPPINTLPQVDKTQVEGYRPMEYLIRFDMDKLNYLKIKFDELKNSLSQYFKSLSLGKTTFGDAYVTVRIKNDQFSGWTIPITKRQNRIIYLTDIAKIVKQEQPANSYFRMNGKNALSLLIYPQKSANTLQLSQKIERIISQQKKLLPADLQIIKTYDSTEYLQKELHKIYNRSFWVVVVLLLFVLLVSRSFKYFLIVVVSLLANLGIAFLFYYLFDIQIQLYSLAGITISFGLMIDNSIVMIDHLKRYQNRKVFLAVLASTLTTIGALLVIYFLKDEMKTNLIDFAYVIVINLFVSLIVAMLLIPALVSQFRLANTRKQKANNNIFLKIYNWYIPLGIKYKKILIVLAILVFGLPVFMLPQKIDSDSPLAKIYNRTLGNDWYVENARPYVNKYLGGTLRLFSHYVFEGAYYRENKETKLYVLAQSKQGANIEQLNEVMLQLDNYLQQYNQIKNFKTRVYGNYAQITITFKDDNLYFPYELKSILIRKALDWGGINWNIYGIGKGFSTGIGGFNNENFRIVATGYNYNHLNNWIDTLKNSLLKHPRINHVRISSDLYRRRPLSLYNQLKLNDKTLSLYNTNLLDIYKKIKALSLKKQPDLYLMIDDENMPVRFLSQQSEYFDKWHLLQSAFLSGNGIYKLKNLTTITNNKEADKIITENQNYKRYLNIQYTGASKFGKKVIKRKMDSLQSKLPIGINFKLNENVYYFSQQSENYFYLLIFIIIFIWALSAVFFESFRLAFIVISIIPISFIGIFLTFYLFDFTFDQGGIAAFILISGITVNAVYYLLNDYKLMQKITSNHITRYLFAFKNKIFPILLTVISTILGFIPFIINGQNEIFWFALATGTIGGLIFSMLGIVFYLPVLLLKKDILI